MGVMYHKHRLEALSDAVFAVAMTLLVLELKVPHELSTGGLGAALQANGQLFFSFVLTFVIAAVFWTLQHRVFDAIKDARPESLVLTFAVLGLVSLLPFSTALAGEHAAERLSFELYFLNMFLIAAALTLKMELAHRRGAMHEGADTNELRFRLYRMSLVMLTAAIAARYLPQQKLWFPPIAVAVLFRLVKPRAIKELSTH